DGAELRRDLLHAVLAGLEVGDVPLEGPDAGFGGELAGPLVVAGVDRGDDVTLVPERDRDRFADAAGSARDDRHSRHDVLRCDGPLQARSRMTLDDETMKRRTGPADPGLS